MDDPSHQSETKTIRERIALSLLGQVNSREIILKSLGMAVGATAFAAPYFYHLLHLSPMPAVSLSPIKSPGFLFMELFLLFMLCLLCAMVGFCFAGRRGFPGIGDWSAFVRDIPWLCLLGVSLMTLSILFFDLRFIEISPASYPKNHLYLFTFPFKSAFTDETILRLGLVTICVGLFRRRLAGIIFVAVLAVFFSMRYFQFVGIDLSTTNVFFSYILTTFLANLILGYLFVTRGLLYAMGLSFILKLKFVVIALAM